jgi:hypothetical protein
LATTTWFEVRVSTRDPGKGAGHGSVFGDEVAAAAVIDRLLHFSTTVNIRGESYRLKDKRRAGVFSTPAAKSAS